MMAIAAAALLATISQNAVAAPAPFAAVAPAQYAHLATLTPTLSWQQSSSAGGPITYTVVVDGQDAGTVDDAACATTCSWTPSSPLSEAEHTWSVVASDTNGDTQTTQREITLDVTAPTIILPKALSESGLDRPGFIFDSACPRPRIGLQDAGGISIFSPTLTLDGRPVPATVSYMGVVRPEPPCMLTAGPHTLTVTATDYAGNTGTATTTFVTDLIRPALSVEGPQHAVKGTTQTFRATVAPGTAALPLDCLWNLTLDDQRSVHPSTNACELRVPFTFDIAFVDAEVVDAEGDRTEVILRLASGPPPPKGTTGVAIAGGRYTTRRHTTLHLAWPAGATNAKITNPANGKTETIPVAASIRWTLAGSGRSRTPTTVRVRFDWPLPAKTYSARVVVDTQRPKLISAIAEGGKLRLNAIDTGSGLAKVQLASRRSRPAKYRRYGSTLNTRSARWVRVIDKADNRSAWHRIK
jgi:hypothetical protein